MAIIAKTCTGCGEHKPVREFRGTSRCIGCLVNPPPPTWPPTYEAVHAKMRKLLNVRAVTCQLCLKVPAEQWAYDRTDGEELPSSRGPYSLDPGKYVPLCVTCHHWLDDGYRRLMKWGERRQFTG